jgi:hypothetical protein
MLKDVEGRNRVCRKKSVRITIQIKNCLEEHLRQEIQFLGHILYYHVQATLFLITKDLAFPSYTTVQKATNNDIFRNGRACKIPRINSTKRTTLISSCSCNIIMFTNGNDEKMIIMHVTGFNWENISSRIHFETGLTGGENV